MRKGEYPNARRGLTIMSTSLKTRVSDEGKAQTCNNAWLHQLTLSVRGTCLFCAGGTSLPSTFVHLLWHVHNEDEKLIVVYATNAEALGAQERLSRKPGFLDTAGI